MRTPRDRYIEQQHPHLWGKRRETNFLLQTIMGLSIIGAVGSALVGLWAFCPFMLAMGAAAGWLRLFR